MDWTDLVGPLAKLGAPLLGGALGGPLGAAAGKIVADAFGASDASPAAVNAAIAGSDPVAAATAAQAAAARGLAALAEIGRAQVAEIGTTMRAEAASQDALQRWWRPLYALELSLIECPAFTRAVLTLLQALWRGHGAGISGFANLSGLLIAYFGARFGVLGVYVSARSREMRGGANAGTSVVADVVKALRRK